MKKFVLSIAVLLVSIAESAQNGYQPTAENLDARNKFQDNKFGIFIHWGIYSMLGAGEWVMNNRNIDYREYAKLASGFYPSKFNANEWVKAIKASGAKYITITSRHHDGFSMFGTKADKYNIVDATPFGRDVMKELAEACRSEGIALHFYYSHLDWYRADYPLGRTGRMTGRATDKQDWNSYYAFMNKQLTELLTDYGPIGVIWFDGFWDHDSDEKPFDWQLSAQYNLIHSLQPTCLVANNHHEIPFEGEDIQIFERDLPGENKAGYSGKNGISRLSLETCETMNGSWGYNITDSLYKSSKELIHFIVRAAGRNANLLLNIGPQPNGQLPAEAVLRLGEIGKWMAVYGETIYGTRGGIIAPHEWGVSTQKGNKLYVHLLNMQDKELFLPLGNTRIANAVMFDTRRKVDFTRTKNGINIALPAVPKDIDSIVELTIK